MRIPEDAVIAQEKLADYLLVFRARAVTNRGFWGWRGLRRRNLGSWSRRFGGLPPQVLEDSENEYGVFLTQRGNLLGPTGVDLKVTLVWLRWHSTGDVHLVTLKPWKS